MTTSYNTERTATTEIAGLSKKATNQAWIITSDIQKMLSNVGIEVEIELADVNYPIADEGFKDRLQIKVVRKPWKEKFGE